jgi:alpha-glucosidase (family GH31 glycosyl hydrolase)
MMNSDSVTEHNTVPYKCTLVKSLKARTQTQPLWQFFSEFEIPQHLNYTDTYSSLPSLVLLNIVQTGIGVHPTSYPMDTGGSFPGGKAAEAWNWPLTSNQFWGQENVDLYIFSPILLNGVERNYLSTGTPLPLPYWIILSDWNSPSWLEISDVLQIRWLYIST